jgi:signal-transduction protein with cAMP-binding, CBS, and nucleotidyltransferase domain
MEKEKLNEALICNENDDILEVSRILRDTGQRHLIVVDSNIKPKGIISTVDINNRVVSQEKIPKEVKASEIMTSPIVSIELSKTYQEAYELMIEKNLYSIPITQDNKLIGLLDFNRLFMRVKECGQ